MASFCSKNEQKSRYFSFKEVTKLTAGYVWQSLIFKYHKMYSIIRCKRGISDLNCPLTYKLLALS